MIIKQLREDSEGSIIKDIYDLVIIGMSQDLALVPHVIRRKNYLILKTEIVVSALCHTITGADAYEEIIFHQMGSYIGKYPYTMLVIKDDIS